MSVLQQLGVRHEEEPDKFDLSAHELVELADSAIQPLPGLAPNAPVRLLRHDEVVQLSRAIQLGQRAISTSGGESNREREEIINGVNGRATS